MNIYGVTSTGSGLLYLDLLSRMASWLVNQEFIIRVRYITLSFVETEDRRPFSVRKIVSGFGQFDPFRVERKSQPGFLDLEHGGKSIGEASSNRY